jgi:predicted ATP-grasp superfamily ATP-dependent carboligase
MKHTTNSTKTPLNVLIHNVIYVVGKLRHPFRLYANEKGTVCVLVCESPIMIQGIHSVLDTVMKWALNAKCTEVVVLDGIAIQGMFEGKREPMILSSDGQVADKANLLHDEEYNNNKHSFFNTAFIGGTAGGTLIVMLIQWHCMQSTAHSSN